MKSLPEGLSPLDIRNFLQDSSTMEILREIHSEAVRAEEDACDQERVFDPQVRAERAGRAAAEALVRKAAELRGVDHSEWTMPKQAP